MAATAKAPDGFTDFCAGKVGIALGDENIANQDVNCSVGWSAFNFLIVNAVFVFLWLILWLSGHYVERVRDRLPHNWPFITLLMDANWCLWAMAGACAAATDLNKEICSSSGVSNSTNTIAADINAICETTLYKVCSASVGQQELHPHDFGCNGISSQLGAGTCFTFFMWFAWLAVVVIDYKAWKMDGLQEFNDDLGPNDHESGGPADGQDIAKYDNGSSQASF